MRSIIATVNATLDGYIDNPHLWAGPYASKDTQAYVTDLGFDSDALLLGRVTFEGMAQVWPHRSDPHADHVNSIRKYVVSSTLTEAGQWANATIVRPEELADTVTGLKNQPGRTISVWGFGQLTDALVRFGLLDQYRILLYPVLRGAGQPMFRGGVEAALQLTGSRVFDTGVLALEYRPAAP